MNAPASDPSTIEGRHLVIGILTVGLLLAGFGWWWHWQQVAPSLELWGSDHALRLRDAKQSEVFRLTDSAETGESLVVDGQSRAILERKDASKTKGNPDVRRALLSDFAFVDTPVDAQPQWEFALQLRDGTGTSTFAYSPSTDQIMLVETGARATVTPVAPFIEAFFIRTLEGREPFDPPPK